MQLRIGYELIYSFPQPTPMILLVNVHDSRAADLVVPDRLVTEPALKVNNYRDSFGNECLRLLAPAGRLRLAADGIIRDNGEPDVVNPAAEQYPVEDLPDDTLMYLLGSRYCETDVLCQTAWQLFGGAALGMRAYKLYATMCITTSHSITKWLVRRAALRRRSMNELAFAAITRISRLASAAL